MSPVPDSEREGRFQNLQHVTRSNPRKAQTRRFRLLAGIHVGDDGQHHGRGDIVESKLDLVGVFGEEKFQALSHLDEDEDAKHARAIAAEHERHAKVVAEAAARAAADVEAHRGTSPKPLTPEEAAESHQRFVDDKNRAAGLEVTEQEKAKTTVQAPTPTPKPPQRPAQKPKAPAVTPQTKEQAKAHLNAMSVADLKKLAEDEELDVSECKSKDELVRALLEDDA